MAILYGRLMLPDLIWFTPFAVKSVWPQTRAADLDPAGNCNTRLLPASATNTFPLASSFTSNGPFSPLSDACGAVPEFAVIDATSDWPRIFLAVEPITGLVGNTRTRL